MKNVFLESTIYYDPIERECIAVMDEIKIESGLYAGTVFVVVMDRFGQHDMIHETRFSKRIKLETFRCSDAHNVRRVLLELSFVNGIKDKARFINGFQLLSI